MNIFKQTWTDLNMTKKAVAAITGVSQSTVTTWENGTGFPAPAALKKLAELTGISEETFIKEAGSLPDWKRKRDQP